MTLAPTLQRLVDALLAADDTMLVVQMEMMDARGIVLK